MWTETHQEKLVLLGTERSNQMCDVISDNDDVTSVREFRRLQRHPPRYHANLNKGFLL